MAYTTINKSTDYFNTKLYTGNGSAGNAQTGIGHQPDFVWLKSRTNGEYHNLYDSIRGATKRLSSNLNSTETTISGLTSFNSDGFTVGAADTANQNSQNFVAWNWKAGTTSGITTNASTDTTPSSYSFNQTSGLSIVKYSGNGSTPTKIAHGLGVAPKMIIVKRLTGTADWVVGHDSMEWGKYIYLSSSAASVTAGGAAWENAAPDSINFTVGNNTQINASGSTYIAYCFAEKTGYSKFGSYIGNASTDGTFVYTGFKPAFVMVKKYAGTGAWFMKDAKRNPYNPAEETLAADSASSAAGWGTGDDIDLLSNGFKMRDDTANINTSGDGYIYMSFAEAPLVGGTGAGVPCTAR